MDNIIATDIAPYLQGLGLASAPFVGAPDSMPYFSATSRRKTLDMILYLARYSDLALLVHGPTGCGKSALLREVAARAGLNIQAVHISGQTSVTAQVVYDTLINSFKLITAPSGAEQPLVQIKEQLDHLQRKGYHCIVFVDQADQLATDAYPALEQLIDLRGETGRNLLSVVLFAQNPDKITLRGPSVRHRVKRIEVPPLAADEIGPYLQHRLHHAGGDALFTSLFDERTLAHIARDSHGWPGAMNALAQQRLLKFAARKHPDTAPVEMRAFSKKQFAAISVAVAVLLAVFAFQEEINRAFKAPATVATAQAVAPVINVPVMKLPELIPAVAPPVAEIPANPTTPEMPPPSPEQPPALAVANPAPVTAAVAPAAPTEVIAAPVTPPPVAATPPTAKPSALRDDWLLAQDPEVFTLQVAGSSDESDVRRALRKYGFASDTAIFTTRKKGKPWYGLVTGIYTDSVSAQQARAALPEELMRGTWVRRMRAVQSEINKTAETETPTDVTATPPPAATSGTN